MRAASSRAARKIRSIREIETIRDTVGGFTGVISDSGRPDRQHVPPALQESRHRVACRRPSCVYPGICPNLNTDHAPLISLYRRARALKGIKKMLIASGVRYDLAIESPEYVKELAHITWAAILKIAPEAIGEGPLSKMMKPGVGAYYKFKELFDKYSKEAGKEQYLIPYFIAAHPGTRDEDMLELAVWLKKNGFRADQVQAFLPSPMATATAMYHSGKNPLKRVTRSSEEVSSPRASRCAVCTRPFCATTIRRTGRCLREALEAHGPRGSDRQRQASFDSGVPAGGDPVAGVGGAAAPRPNGAPRAGKPGVAVSHPAHRLAEVRLRRNPRPAAVSAPKRRGR
jgi:uncharacterized radical SAM protein YgiQ